MEESWQLLFSKLAVGNRSVSFCQIYCCTGFLSLTGQLHQLNADLLGWWLCERQLPSGGLNGRPEKVLASVRRLHSCVIISFHCLFF